MRDDETLALVVAALAGGFLLARHPRAIVALLHSLGPKEEKPVIVDAKEL